MKNIIVSLALAVSALSLSAQAPVSVKSMSRIQLPAGIYAGRQAISPDGSFIIINDENSISRVDVTSRNVSHVTTATHPYHVQVSPDGSQVVYSEPTYIEGMRHVALKNVSSAGGNANTIIAPTRYLSAGISLRSGSVNAVVDRKLQTKALTRFAPTEAPVVAINYGHLDVTVDGVTKSIDPQGPGSYLWPALSPDGTKIVYWCVGDGCFVCDLDGKNVHPIGRVRAAVWAGNDLIVGMDSHDDGRKITDSRLVASDLKGNKTYLTENRLIAMYPSATADGSKVAFSTGDALYILDLQR